MFYYICSGKPIDFFNNYMFFDKYVIKTKFRSP